MLSRDEVCVLRPYTCSHFIELWVGKATNDLSRSEPSEIGECLKGFGGDIAFVGLPAHRDSFIEGLHFVDPSAVEEFAAGVPHLRTDLRDDGRHNAASAVLGSNVEPLDIAAVRAPEHIVDESPLCHADHALAARGDEQVRHWHRAEVGLAQLRVRAGMVFRRMALYEVVDHLFDVVQVRLTSRSDSECLV